MKIVRLSQQDGKPVLWIRDCVAKINTETKYQYQTDIIP